MKTKNDWLYLFNKIDIDTYLESNDDEKFNYFKRILIDEFEDFVSETIENMLNSVDGFVNFLNNLNSRLSWVMGTYKI